MSKYRVTKSYDYKVECDVCHFVIQASEAKLRWDGLWVCKDDWEVRHPLDFYKTRNDAHKLPFVRSSSGADPELTWTPTVANLTTSVVGKDVAPSLSPTGYYELDTLKVKTRAIFNLTFTAPSFSDSSKNLPVKESFSTTTSTSASFALPTTPTTAGVCTVINDRGQVIAKATISAGNATVTLPSWTKKVGSLTVSSIYGT